MPGRSRLLAGLGGIEPLAWREVRNRRDCKVLLLIE